MRTTQTNSIQMNKVNFMCWVMFYWNEVAIYEVNMAVMSMAQTLALALPVLCAM